MWWRKIIIARCPKGPKKMGGNFMTFSFCYYFHKIFALLDFIAFVSGRLSNRRPNPVLIYTHYGWHHDVVSLGLWGHGEVTENCVYLYVPYRYQTGTTLHNLMIWSFVKHIYLEAASLEDGKHITMCV